MENFMDYPGGIFSFSAFILQIAVIMYVANWMLYEKAGRQGWESIIPVYNMIVLLKIAKLSPWLVILLLIPGANVIMWIILAVKLVATFGKRGIGFAIGMIFLPWIFCPILAFGDAKYIADKTADIKE